MFVNDTNIDINTLLNLSNFYNIKVLSNAYEYTLVGNVYISIKKEIEAIIGHKTSNSDDICFDITNINFMYNSDSTYDFTYTFNRNISEKKKNKLIKNKNKFLYDSDYKFYISDNKIKAHINIYELLLNKVLSL